MFHACVQVCVGYIQKCQKARRKNILSCEKCCFERAENYSHLSSKVQTDYMQLSMPVSFSDARYGLLFQLMPITDDRLLLTVDTDK